MGPHMAGRVVPRVRQWASLGRTLSSGPGDDGGRDPRRWFDARTRVRKTPFEKAAMAASAAVGALRDPTRADLVATLGETTGGIALERMR